MGVNSLPKTVTRQRRDCDLNAGRSASEYSTLTTRLPSHNAVTQLIDLQTKSTNERIPEHGIRNSIYVANTAGLIRAVRTTDVHRSVRLSQHKYYCQLFDDLITC